MKQRLFAVILLAGIFAAAVACVVYSIILERSGPQPQTLSYTWSEEHVEFGQKPYLYVRTTDKFKAARMVISQADEVPRPVKLLLPRAVAVQVRYLSTELVGRPLDGSNESTIPSSTVERPSSVKTPELSKHVKSPYWLRLSRDDDAGSMLWIEFEVADLWRLAGVLLFALPIVGLVLVVLVRAARKRLNRKSAPLS